MARTRAARYARAAQRCLRLRQMIADRSIACRSALRWSDQLKGAKKVENELLAKRHRLTMLRLSKRLVRLERAMATLAPGRKLDTPAPKE